MELQIFKVYENTPGYTSLAGEETLEIEAGKHLKIETSPYGAELLNAIVPVGKIWEVSVRVVIKETNA